MPADIQVQRVDPKDPAGVEALLGLAQLVWSDAQKTPRETALAQNRRRG